MTASLTPGPIFTTLGQDPYGQFLYAGTNNGQIYGYKVNPDTGALTTAPGSPYTVPNAAYTFALTSAYQYLYAGVTTSGAPEIDAYEISYNRAISRRCRGVRILRRTARSIYRVC
jgi:hypothetical protein